ncbi:hypothetical protein BN2476_20060 [Paraburkholderia piptadeniae]|uniref:Uncharacterized protein n=1 Tax=Paraburkholderia piptadeniae TaxID=1701573 RepID=A0A1N7RJ71_9BURK|nr:hypothetical protein BN2476_20060 [Paraburkholderia piptadeniae]
MPLVSFKSSKIIRYHYAFDPNPDRLTKAFLAFSEIAERQICCLAIASGAFSSQFHAFHGRNG